MMTPLGTGIEENWKSLLAGRSGIGPLTSFDSSGCRTRIAGEVQGFDPGLYMEKKTARRSSRFIQFASACARIAIENAGLKISPENAERTGVSIGTALGGMEKFESSHKLVLEGNRDRVTPFLIPGLICNMAGGEVAIQFGIKGPLKCSVTACAAGTHAIGEAFRLIQFGEADAVVAGGAEAEIIPTVFAGLDALKVMSTRNDDPAGASRPFERDRDGFVCSEGGGIMVLEDLDSALARGAVIYAELVGYGNSCDAYHITTPDPEGKGAYNCMAAALKDAGLKPENIDHINSHGTSTLVNDQTETRAIKKLFGERAYQIPVTSNKSMLGHMWGAAGAVEAIISVMTIDKGVIPPTINYQNADPDCDLDYVPNLPRDKKIDTVLSNSFGFGGTNGCLLFARYKK